MTIRSVRFLVGFAVAITVAKGDEPASSAGAGRVIVGTVVTAGGRPLEGARVLIGEFGGGMSFVDDAAAATDARGTYRLSLGQFPWAKGALRVLVLSEGFEIGDRKLEPGIATADFQLAAQPWKETLVRLEDESGKPVAGVEVACLLGAATWARPKSGVDGSIRLVMAPELWVSLAAKPDGARPIEMLFAARKDGPASITLPVLQPIRGRVVGAGGKPVPDVAVGRWITFEADGAGEMLSFFSGARAHTDSEGRFAIAPEVQLKGSQLEKANSQHLPWALCFADRSFRRAAFRFFNPTGAAAPMEVTLEPTQRVRVPITGDPLAEYPRAVLNVEISILPRSDAPDLKYYFLTRTTTLEAKAGRPVLEEFLPAGTYELEATLRDEKYTTRGMASCRLVVKKGEGEGPINVPPLELGPPAQRTWFGKPAPEIAAIDLDTGKPVTLADFRGKVVVLDFWGYWCGPCTGGMPYLMDLQQKFKGRSLEIIALHDQSVQSRAEYDQKIAPARRIMWSGRDLPFRVLLDRPDPKKTDDRDPEGTGTTCKRYAVTGFPTLFVIGPDGTLVEQVSHSRHERLEQLVDELLKKAEGR